MRAEESWIRDEILQGFETPDGNLVTYKCKGVKKGSREKEAIGRFVRGTMASAKRDKKSRLPSPN